MEEKPRMGRIVHHQPHELFKSAPRAAAAAARSLEKLKPIPKVRRYVGGRACFSRG